MKTVRMKSRLLAVLAVLLVAAMAAALLAQCNWRQVFALANYTKNYNELTTSELDSLSHRTAVADDLPQMTVFVHGLGGRASHWEKRLQEKKKAGQENLSG